ncbi:MAG: transcriptional repressor LexA [Phycisphaerae bacterium]|nr:transcriptional repressor LexA [Phycisphaerae bacterium]
MARRKSSKVRLPTARQLEILTAIRNYQRSFGCSPTMEEIGDLAGVTKVTAFEHVRALVAKGLLRHSKHSTRSLEITASAVFPDERPTCLPLVGRIAAGAPIEAIEDHETIDLEALFCQRKNTFVLQVNGESMIDEQIRDGDYVVVERRETARDGETVVAVLDDGEATLKKFYREGRRIRLQPANPNFEPIYVDRVSIQGVVVGVLRHC